MTCTETKQQIQMSPAMHYEQVECGGEMESKGKVVTDIDYSLDTNKLMWSTKTLYQCELCKTVKII